MLLVVFYPFFKVQQVTCDCERNNGKSKFLKLFPYEPSILVSKNDILVFFQLFGGHRRRFSMILNNTQATIQLDLFWILLIIISRNLKRSRKWIQAWQIFEGNVRMRWFFLVNFLGNQWKRKYGIDSRRRGWEKTCQAWKEWQ